MGEIKAGVASPSSGGQGSAPNLVNAGAASAALTAAMTKKSQQQAAVIVRAMQKAQADAAAAAKANPATVLPHGMKVNGDAAVYNGLKAGWLEAYNPSGSVDANNVPSTWSGVSSLGQKSDQGMKTVNIVQNQQNAYLYWKNFNVGPNTTVNFDQGAGGKSVGNWISFNTVKSPSDPSHIFGKITGQGQVYILNQNGILFHNGSLINVRSLVASTLPINPNLSGVPSDNSTTPVKASGLANNPDYQFMFSALPEAKGNIGPIAAFTPAVTAPIGDIVIEPGAMITASVDSAHSGGLVALVAPNVLNQGTINTPNGQTVLAAGLEVGMTPHPSSDPSLRGLDFYVGKVSDPSISTFSVVSGAVTTGTTGTARNDGLIEIPEGNATIVGKTVSLGSFVSPLDGKTYHGAIDGTTSVSFNGSIDLHANYGVTINDNYNQAGHGQPLVYQSTGLVQIGPDNVLQLLPETGNSATVTGTSLALNSIVSILGSSVDFAAGSILEAPGAVATPGAVSVAGLSLSSGVTVQAGSWYDAGNHNLQFLRNAGQIYLDSGSVIDVSGSADVQVSSAQNFVKLQLRGAQLAGEVLQDNKNNPIYGRDLTVDITKSGSYNGTFWIGTPLGDATGYAALVQRGVAQLTTAGGSVSLLAGDSVVVNPNALINVSGGWTRYSGGSFATSKLITSTGQIVDISQATPNQIYTGIVKDPTPVYEAPYYSGGNGGAITIQAASVALDGNLAGTTVAGMSQLRPPVQGASSTLPSSSSFTLGLSEQTVLPNRSVVSISPYAPPVITIAAPPASLDAIPSFAFDNLGNALPLPASRQSQIWIDPSIASSAGFGSITIDNHDGSVKVPTATSLTLGPGGRFSLGAAAITLNGSIVAPGGAVSLTSYMADYAIENGIFQLLVNSQPILNILSDSGETVAQYGSVGADGSVSIVHQDGSISTVSLSSLSPVGTAQSFVPGTLKIGQSAVLDVSGSLVNDYAAPGDNPIIKNGGSLSLSAYELSLARNAVLSVSGGAYVNPIGYVSYGNAGKISIYGGQDAEVKDIHGGFLSLGATLKGYAGFAPSAVGSPGTLSIKAPAVTITGGSPVGAGISLNPGFFNQGGFGNFNLTGIGIGVLGDANYVPAVSIASGVAINPQIQSMVLDPSGTGMIPATRDPLLGHAPTLTLNAAGLQDSSLPSGQNILVIGNLIQSPHSSITLSPSLIISSGVASASVGSLVLSGDTIEEMGGVSVPGGAISFNAGKSLASLGGPQQPGVTVDIAPAARLSADGTQLVITDPSGLRSSFGEVLPGGSISIIGNTLARSGSVIEANGTSGVFTDFTSGGVVTYRKDSGGGSISITGGQALYLESSLNAESGGPGASGGALTINSGNYLKTQASDLSLVVSQSGVPAPNLSDANGIVTTVAPNTPAVSLYLPATDNNGLSGGGHLGVTTFQSGGFDSLFLGGNILLTGPQSGMQISSRGSITLGTGAVIESSIPITLSAPVVNLGMPFDAPLLPSDPKLTTIFGSLNTPEAINPRGGTGNLTINAGTLINVGNLSLHGIGAAQLSVPHGAVRGDGSFVIAGDLTMAAAQISPSTGTIFNVVAFNYDANGVATGLAPGTDLSVDVNSPDIVKAGSITIKSTVSSLPAPLSAGGALKFYASTILQSGNLIAPFGEITLGASGGSANPQLPLTPGLAAPDTEQLTLKGSSVTSVSGAGVVVPVPYGSSSDGSSWNDPSGNNITGTGLPAKGVTLGGISVTMESGSTLDLSGGGDLQASRWVSGLGGTVNILGSPSAGWVPSISYNQGDLVSYNGQIWSARQGNQHVSPSVGLNWTLVPQSYAILPGYTRGYAPTGYSEGSLGVGSSVSIVGGGGLSAGTYTLLPASYASLPGGYLLTVSSLNRNTEAPVSYKQLDGTTLISGTLFNQLSQGITPAPNTSLFTLSSPSEIAKEVLYQNLSAGQFFAASGKPLPGNGGNLSVSAISSFTLESLAGSGALVKAKGAGSAPGGFVSLASPGQWSIGAAGGDVQINPAILNSWSYGGLLLGGTLTAQGEMNVVADSITVGSKVSLSGNDLIMAANHSIDIMDGASLTASGADISPYENITVNGDGALLRVSSDPLAAQNRYAVPSGSSALLQIGQNVMLNGKALILDSAGQLFIDPSSQLNSQGIAIAASSVAMVLDSAPSPSLSGDLATYDSSSLVIQGGVLESLQRASSLSIASYSTLDLYGSSANQPNGLFGGSTLLSLSLHAGEIRGFDLGGGSIALQASRILLDNSTGATSAGAVTASPDGSLVLNAGTISLGKNPLAIDQFGSVALNATGVLVGVSSGAMTLGTGAMPTDLSITAPLITALAGSTLTVNDSGNLVMVAPDPAKVTTSTVVPGAGASLSLTGSSVSVDSKLSVPSGTISLSATSGNLIIGGNGQGILDVTGVSKQVHGASVTADAGTIQLNAIPAPDPLSPGGLASGSGNVSIGGGSLLVLTASGASSAGLLAISCPQGVLSIDPAAVLKASGGSEGGGNGKFSLDAATLDSTGQGTSLLSSIIPQLGPDKNGKGGFTQSLSFRIRTGDVTIDNPIKAHSFSLSADQGTVDLTPSGAIDASGVTGGSVSLEAAGSLILEPNSSLSVHASTYDAAGKGGLIFLSAGAETDGQINPNALLGLQAGSTIDLAVTATATSIQDFGGVLHLRAPMTQNGADIQIAQMDSTVNGASSIAMEGYQLYELRGASPDMANSVPVNVQGNSYSGNQTVQELSLAKALSFFGTAGTTASGAGSLLSRLTANQPSAIANILNLSPGVEVINQSGDLVLGPQHDWDFSTFRVGANAAPGFLTLRASENVTLHSSLSDGFSSSGRTASLLTLNPLLPVNFQSWSYQITGGADLAASSLSKIVPVSSGSINLGVSARNTITASGGLDATTASAITGQNARGSYSYYQVIRTGSGSIDLAAAGNVYLWNQFASIYTAGTQVSDPTLGGTFDVPKPNYAGQGAVLGAIQQQNPYPVQYSMAGGNVSIMAGGDVAHVSLNTAGLMVPDSTAQLPTDWLYRRSALDSVSGKFLQVTYPSAEVQSTTSWMDFSNFLEGVGALGGGNVGIIAGGNVSNVDALVPTNYRMPGHAQGSISALFPDPTAGIELGGGNLLVRSGKNLDAGVYYVENGQASLKAGGSIITNPTRDPQLALLGNPSSSLSYLPTTLLLGKGSASVTAVGDITMGPVANAFLLPEGLNNSFWYKTYFSTYAPTTSVQVQSLGGDVTLRTEAYTPSSGLSPMLQLWMADKVTPVNGAANFAYYQPWVRINETSVSSLGSLMSLMPSSLSMQSVSGNITLQGSITLAPSPTGELQLVAGGSINGLADSGYVNGPELWSSSTINLSDANPASVPSISNPLSQRTSNLTKTAARPDGRQATSADYVNSSGILSGQMISLFAETGSYFGNNGSLTVKQTLHDSSPLHQGDSIPLQIFAGTGWISGLTLYSAKSAQVIAGGDIADVGLYLQNIAASDVSIVSAGGSITTYDPGSSLQLKAQGIYKSENLSPALLPLQSGDIQISGPGTLEVLAGGNLDLGNNPGVSDPTLNVGITSIGNSRNPALPFQSADIIASAGIKLPTGLSSEGVLQLQNFASTVLSGADGASYLGELAGTMAYSGAPLAGAITAASFSPDSTQLSADEKARLELQLFYIVLRDTGRNYSNKNTPGYRSYATGYQAIQALLGNNYSPGNIITWSQNISTLNGGDISLLAPGGGVSMGAINYKSSSSAVAPGLITQGGGDIYIYTKNNVAIGIGRIFTLKGGDIMIWSNKGNIAAGASSKTVQSAPPTQVLVDPTSALVVTDLAGLATGGGIGALQTVLGVAPANIDLIAPSGVIDAGDAGIRASGNLHLAATKILNADNIAVGGISVGAPAAAPASAPPAAPPPAAAPPGASAAAAANNNAADQAGKTAAGNGEADQAPSIISVDILGYGGGGDEEDDSERKAADASVAPIQASL